MNSSKMKNMIVLKNLPSNIIDEAFVFLKTNKKIKIFENCENQRETIVTQNNSKDYIVNEAEMLINKYLSNLEKEKSIKSVSVKKLENKCKKMKIIIAILIMMLFLSFTF